MIFTKCEHVHDEIHCYDGINIYRYFYPMSIVHSGSWVNHDNSIQLTESCTTALYTYYASRDINFISSYRPATSYSEYNHNLNQDSIQGHNNQDKYFVQYYDSVSKLIYRWRNGWKTPCVSHDHDIILPDELLRNINLARIRFEYKKLIAWMARIKLFVPCIYMINDIANDLTVYIIDMITVRKIACRTI